MSPYGSIMPQWIYVSTLQVDIDMQTGLNANPKSFSTDLNLLKCYYHPNDKVKYQAVSWFGICNDISIFNNSANDIH